ncbi:unnamed protein product [Orchesella dallaii]|uniref:Odorant receptor n=1 Tax=Orchesella dallaii TaxID=48710 RepID=A0ABP1RLP1_9HEXA
MVVSNYKEIPAALVSMAFMSGAISVMAWAPSAVIISNPYEFVNRINSLARLQAQLDTNMSIYRTQPWYDLENRWKRIAFLLKVLVMSYAIIPAALLTTMIIAPEPVDPFFYTVPLILPTGPAYRAILSCTSSGGSIVSSAVRFTLSVICISTVCRFFAIFFPTVACIIELQSRCLDTLKLIPVRRELNWKFVKWFKALRIANENFNGQISVIFAIFAADGFLIFVVCNVVTINRYNISIEVYWIAPTISAICAFIAYGVIPILFETNRKSKLLLWIRSIETEMQGTGRNKNRTRQEFRCLRPIAFQCGPFMTVECGFDQMLFSGILERTFDAFLLFQ